ncbi:MAG: nucleotidyl transferase AbiEii/AbiGii toxin family protein [Ignavibacteriales bacterium]|nr:nucleotidyl transferase AbiEii/AbiGii toxin family protein [Ignavibacteriales bacterium]
MHKEILTENQLKLLSLLKDFSNDYILVGGTAIALYLGHRYSIDFDLFTSKVIKRKSIKNYLIKNGHSLNQLIKEEADQIHFMVNDVKITFFQYPFSINETVDFESIIKIPTLINLAAMKAFALGGRGKWKDYVDIYFLLKDHFSLDDIIKRAEGLFGNVFNDKLFREQLTYFEDINYDEEVIYLNTPIDNDVIKKFLIDAATEKF